MCELKVIAFYVCVVAAFAAAQSSVYLNFTSDDLGNAFITQTASKCTTCNFSEQLEHPELTSHVLDSLLQNEWTPVTKADGSTYGTLALNSDLDLGEYDPNTDKCLSKHTPLTFKALKGSVSLGGFTVSNLCYSDTIDFSESTSKMSKPVGLFSRLDSVYVTTGVELKNVRINVTVKNAETVPSSAGTRFYSVGALAGQAVNSKIWWPVLTNVKISGLVAGGVVGFAQNTSLYHVSSTDKVYISNDIALNSDDLSAKNIPWTAARAIYLGGAVGYGLNVNYQDVNLDVNIQNKVTNNAALGGLAGTHVLSSADNNSDSTWMHIDSVNISAAALDGVGGISGGSSMGGLFGESMSFHGNEAGLDVKVENSSFDGTITDSRSDSAYVGGLVGRDVMPKNALMFVNCKSNFKIDDTRYEGVGHYYAGGYVGMGVCYSGGSRDAFVTIANSKATGSINYTNNVVSTSASEAYVGGLAGFACFAVNDSAILADTVTVNISANTSMTNSADFLWVGGFVGKAGIYEGAGSGLKVANSVYAGDIALNGNLNGLYAAGGIGQFYRGESGNFVDFENVSITGNPIVNTNATVTGNMKMGGLCGECRTPRIISNVSVTGDIDVKGTLDGVDSLIVGGIMGMSTAGGNPNTFNLINNFFIGNIDAEQSVSTKYLGYLVGYLSTNNYASPYTAVSNYHYGTDSVGMFGHFISVNAWAWEKMPLCDTLSSNSSTSCWNKSHNVRNGAADSLDGENNGAVTESFMKSADMATFLNTPWDNTDSAVWLYDSEKNNGFPYQKNAALSVVEPMSSSSSSKQESSSSSVKSSSSSNQESSSSSARSSSSSNQESSSSAAKSSSSSKQESSSSSVKSSSSSKQESSSSSDKSSSSSNQEFSSSSVKSSSSSSEWIEESSSSEFYGPSIVMETGSWNMISLKLLKKEGYSVTSEDALYWWDEGDAVGEYWQYKAYSNANKGEGTRAYWFWNANEVTSHEDLSEMDESAEVTWTLDSVYSGWNMVANPYAWSVGLSDANLEGLEIWHRNATTGEYEPASELNPYEGAWVKSGSYRTVTFSAKHATGALKKTLAKSSFAETDGWALTATLSDGNGKKDSWNVMGTATESNLEEEPPANMGDHVSLSIMDGKRKLAKSLVQEADANEWTIKLSATSARDGYLKLNGISEVNALGKRVYVTVDGNTTEMTEGKSLKVSLKKTASTATVTVTSGAAPVVSVKTISNLGSVRTADGLNVNFEISSDLANRIATVEAVSVTGEVVAKAKFNANAGANAVNLNIKNRGVYVLHVRVGSQSATRRTFIQ